jgi:hypothetical protein
MWTVQQCRISHDFESVEKNAKKSYKNSLRKSDGFWSFFECKSLLPAYFLQVTFIATFSMDYGII